MGSGLILLVIVGAWLAVLVPLALRSSEYSNASSTVDAFHDAMRVLSRRESVVRAPEPVEVPASSRLSPVARRRRVLLALAAAALLTLAGAVLGPGWVLGLHLLADALLVGCLVWLRHTTVQRQERERRARARSASPAPGRPVEAEDIRTGQPAVTVVDTRTRSRIAGVPERMPSRAAVGTALYAAAPAASAPADPAPARGAQGRAWSPVPVPLPAYLTAPTAPRRRIDLTGGEQGSDRGAEAAPRKLAVND